MKKVININFQGRIIPIEETAFEALQAYTQSLRRYFAAEEGRDEIINDIENRIAELCSDRLAHTHCITDEDINHIIATIGRPEDFGDEPGPEPAVTTPPPSGNGRFYRNSDDRLLGGVCSGLANYLKTDPVLIRILFVFLSGAIFWLYFLLWLIVPARSLQTKITKRFYRDPEHKVLGGVCSGLAAYFHTEVWIPRLVFCLPLISVLLSGTWNQLFDNWAFHDGWNLLSGSLGSSLFLMYIVLWIVVPAAKTAADRLEMKGEKIDLNSIRDTVKDNIGQFQVKAEQLGREMQASAQRISTNTESGLVSFLRFILKAIAYFAATLLALVLLAIFIGVAFGGIAVFPLKNLLLEGNTENVLAWSSLALVIGVPLIGIITWLIRRITGVRQGKSYLSAIFGILWLAGLVCLAFLCSLVYRDLKFKHSEVKAVAITQPATDTLVITAASRDPLERYKTRFWNDLDETDGWLAGVSKDSFLLKNVKVHVEPSADSQYHIYQVMYSRGGSLARAQSELHNMHFDLVQEGNRIVLPAGIRIGRNSKFRNQQVMVVVEVPPGKHIFFDKSLRRFSWMTFRTGGKQFSIETESEGIEHDYNIPYVMTASGIRSLETPANAAGELPEGARALDDFERLSLDLPVQVRLHAADRYYVVLDGNADLIRQIRTVVRSQQLHITAPEFHSSNDDAVFVDVYAPEYETLELNGSGRISSDNVVPLAETVSLTLNGSGQISLKGNCRKQQLALSGSGKIDTRDLVTEQAAVQLAGSGNMIIQATGQVSGSLSGSGTITNTGPGKANVHIAGSGKYLQQ